MHYWLRAGLLAATALTLAACGGGYAGEGSETATGKSSPSSPPPAPTTASVGARRVEVRMADGSFAPGTVDVAVGEEVTFVFTNTDKVAHDAFVGDKAAQDHHESEMRGAGGHTHGNAGAGITVAPGETGEIRHRFPEAGHYEVGCHQPGHYAAGMKLTVKVE